MSIRERIFDEGDFIQGWTEGDEESAARVVKQYNKKMREEVNFSNKILLLERKERLRAILKREMEFYIEELALQDKTFYTHRL